MAKSSLIGRIAFDLVANTGPLIKPLKQAESAITKFTSGFSKFTGIGAAISGTVAGLFSVHAAISSVTTTFSELGNLSDESKRLGVSADVLSGLQYAAKQSGVEIETLGKALQYMMKKGMSVQKLFAIADELNAIGDPVLKMQKALAYFGKGGSGLINMLDGGSKQLREMIKQAERLGYVVSQSQADMTEAAGDAWDNITLALSGASRQLAAEIAPYVKYIADMLTEWVISLRVAGEQMTSMAATAGWMADMAETFNLMYKAAKIPTSAWRMMLSGGTWEGPSDVKEHAKDFWKAFTAPDASDRLRSTIDRIRREVLDSVDKGATPPGVTPAGLSMPSMAAKTDQSALLRGSSAALSYILGTTKQDIEKASLDELKGIHRELKDRRDVVIEPAAL